MNAASDLTGFIDASPTQFHAVHNAAARLLDAGFEVFDPSTAVDPGARLVVRDGALLAWVDSPSPARALRIIAAHTDSPNIRIRPRPDTGAVGFAQLGVEVYGGVLLNSWLDRDLGIAGRVAVRSTSGKVESRLFRTHEAQLRVAQLAIHLDRGVNENGLVLDKQRHMTPIWSLGTPEEGDFTRWLAAQVDCSANEVLGFDAACFDIQPSRVLGARSEMLSAPRLDNLCCSFGAVEALIAARWAGSGPALIALFDHEEVGSTTSTGADSAWLANVLEQRSVALGIERPEWLASLDSAMMLSADMAHGTHPNYADRHEPAHQIRLGGGPVIKHNVNARYATDSMSSAAFKLACMAVDVGFQEYSHRGDLSCGSTIGPLASARLAVRTVDVGMAQLSMHSARELMAVADIEAMVRSFTSWLDAP